MTWAQISAEVNRKLVLSASPRVTVPDMLGLLNESYEELLAEWYPMTFEKDEMAIQLLAPLHRGPIHPVPGASFLIDSTLFPGGLRLITSFRGRFLQPCSATAAIVTTTYSYICATMPFNRTLVEITVDGIVYQSTATVTTLAGLVTVLNSIVPDTVAHPFVLNGTTISVANEGVVYGLLHTTGPGSPATFDVTPTNASVSSAVGYEWRNITFLPDNDISDLDNPLRIPTNDVPKYRVYWDTAGVKKKVRIYSDSAPTALEVYYFMTQAVITTVSTGTPEISVEGHYKIVKRAVLKQSGVSEDNRAPYFAGESAKDTQVTTI